MLKDITFKEVCAFLKEDMKDDQELLKAADHFLGLAIVCSPLILGPKALPALKLLGAKSQLVKSGKWLLEKVTGKKETDYLARIKRMRVAHGLICYTAFFEALDKLLPTDLRKSLDLQGEDREQLAKSAGKSLSTQTQETGDELDGVGEEPLPFPHPVSPHEQTEQLGQLYESMAKGFLEFLDKLVLWEIRDAQMVNKFKEEAADLPQLALECFESQYFALSKEYVDFRIWSQITDHKAMTDYLKQYNLLLGTAKKKIDVGLRQLQKTAAAIPDQFQQISANNIVDGLNRHYADIIRKPIIDEKEIPEEDRIGLSFPKISDAFVPQSYRVLRHTSKDIHLEKEETWDGLDSNDDLAAFLLRYLSSPYSIEAPLLILGHPGSGKSLLTKVLCARLTSEAYTPIRVPLRDVENPESRIESLITDQIKNDTNESIESWAGFSRQFTERPLLIILDGYDELLQASGKVFADYLQKVQTFQESEKVQGRPVRVIVTSRVALIDKATVPDGATVIRLLEFNEEQRNTWISVWNKANADYFQSSKVEPFKLPEEQGNGKRDKILELAQQPLLLLMLALYDAEENSLRKHKQLDRTVLYDSLLRRFVWRERRRYVKNLERLPKKDQKQKMEEEIDKEMKRLGAAAIGMYNRRTLYIHSNDLVRDFRFFEIERKKDNTAGHELTDVEGFFGGFFFIHKAKSGGDRNKEDNAPGDFTFEFLHNTFGEFLTAYFILQSAFEEVEMLIHDKENANTYTRYKANIEKAEALSKEWFSCLMYAPLYSRPEIPEMIREWAGNLFSKKGLSRKTFLEHLDEIIRSQIRMVLDSRVFPEIMRSEQAAQYLDMPLLGLIATYTLNLVILRTILADSKFVFSETDYSNDGDMEGDLQEVRVEEQRATQEEGRSPRPWDKLTQIWRSWFRIENLSGLCTILSTKRDGDEILVMAIDEFRAKSASGNLSTVINVAAVLADDTTVGLAGLHSEDSDKKQWLQPGKLKERLDASGIDLSFDFLVRRLRRLLATEYGPTDELDALFMEGLEYVNDGQQSFDLVVAFFDLLAVALRRRCLSWRSEEELFDRLVHSDPIRESDRGAGSYGLQVLRLLRESWGRLWQERYGPKFFDRFMHPKRMHPEYLMDMMENRPEVAVEWILLMQQLGGARWRERYGPKFFDRFMHPKRMHPERLMEMMERRPKLAVEWILLMRQLGGARWRERYGPEFFDRFMHLKRIHPERLMEMMERRPELAVKWIRLMQQLGGERWRERYGPEFFDRFIHPKRMHPEHLMEMMERRPELAVEWVRLMQQFGGERWRERYGPEFFDRLMHPRRLMEMVESRPELAVEWVRLMQQFGGERWRERYGPEFFDRFMDPKRMHSERLMEIMELNRAAIWPVLMILRLSSTDRSFMEDRLMNTLRESIQNSDIAKMPLESLPDLRWFAERVEDFELTAQIERYLQ